MTSSELSPDSRRDLFQAAEAQLRAGNLAAAATLYTALLGASPGDPYLLHRLGVIAGQQGDLDRALNLIGQALEQQPDAWDCRQNFALTLERKNDRAGAAAQYGILAAGLAAAGRLAEALGAYRRALTLDGDNPAWHAGTGQMLGQMGHAAEAVALLRRAAELAPADTGIAANLGAGLLEDRRPAGALSTLRRAVLLDPANAAAWSNLGVAIERAGQAETDAARDAAALAAFDRALAVAPNLGSARINRGLALLRAGRFEEGWAEYEAGSDPLPGPPLPEWRGEPPEETGGVLLLTEQGLGDTLQFCRYALMLADAGHAVELLAQPALRAFLTRAMPHPRLRILDERDQIKATTRAALMKLPNRMGTGGVIPKVDGYLSADDGLVADWRRRLAPAPGERLVGLCWAGNPAHVMDRMRSATLADLAPLSEVTGVRFVSLQVGGAADQTVPAGLELVRFTRDELMPLERLAALTAGLDLVISVDSMPLHLAGALGVPVWGMIAAACDSRWMTGRTDSPWYSSVRLFRQASPGSWAAVARSMAAALADGTQAFRPKD